MVSFMWFHFSDANESKSDLLSDGINVRIEDENIVDVIFDIIVFIIK